MNTWDQKKDEPVEFFGSEELRAALEDYASTTRALLIALEVSAELKSEENEPCLWRPHIPQMRKAVAHFQKLCRAEIRKIGLWREDGLDAEEVHDGVWEQGERLVAWLQRMIGTATG